jgi:hypothetical protein
MQPLRMQWLRNRGWLMPVAGESDDATEEAAKRRIECMAASALAKHINSIRSNHWICPAGVLRAIASLLPHLMELVVIVCRADCALWEFPRGLRKLTLVGRYRAGAPALLLDSCGPDRLPELEVLDLNLDLSSCSLAPLRGHQHLRSWPRIFR